MVLCITPWLADTLLGNDREIYNYTMAVTRQQSKIATEEQFSQNPEEVQYPPLKPIPSNG
jgi:hypothetical protein